MAKIPVKGTQLQQDLSGVYTAVAQLTSVSLSGTENETVETDTLDNTDAVIQMDPTGRTTGGSVDAEMLYDPALQGHKNITALLTTPVRENWRVVYADSGQTTLDFTSAGIGFEATAEQGDFLRGSLSAEVTALTFG